MARTWFMGLFAAALWMGACGGDNSSSGSTGAAEGETCKGGTDCAGSLYCSLKSLDAKEGTCETLPDGCGDTPKCSNECGDLLDKACGGSSICASIAGKITYACAAPTSGTAKEGEACSMGGDCMSGLFCLVKNSAGTCTKAPDECSGTPTCSSGACADAISAACGGGSSSCSGSGAVTLTCG